MTLQESGEMYLETILILSEKSEKVRAIDICEYMGFSKPSVSRGLSILRNGGYINVDDKSYITLTSEGSKVANTIYERHKLLSDFLVKLGVSEDVAIKDACKVEHDISNETFEAIKSFAFKEGK